MENEKTATSPWVKIIAASCLFLALLFGYLTLSQSMNDDCQATATRASVLITVHKTKWTMAGCQYFYSHKYVESEPTWEDGDMFEALHMDNKAK